MVLSVWTLLLIQADTETIAAAQQNEAGLREVGNKTRPINAKVDMRVPVTRARGSL